MQKRLYHDISQCDLNFFHLIRRICYIYILTLINKFHIKYITDMMHLRNKKKKCNSKCMSKYKMLKRIICFNVSVRYRNLSYFEEFT